MAGQVSGANPRHARRGLSALAAIAAAVLASGVATAAPPEVSWTVSRQPSAVTAADPTMVTVTITNTSQSEQIGCIQIAVPAPAFSVVASSITKQPADGRTWTVAHALEGLTTIVTAKASNGGSTLRGGTTRDTLGIGVTVLGVTPGTYTWTASAFADNTCSQQKSLDLTASFSVTVTLLATPAPTPAPTPKSTPAPTPKPTPVPTPGPTTSGDLATAEPSGATPASPDPGSTPADSPGPSSATPSPRLDPSPSPLPGLPAGWLTGGEDPFVVPIGGSAQAPVELSSSMDAGTLALQWGVPAVTLSVPGLLIVVVVIAQSFGGLAWLPFVRRWIGGFGWRRRRSRAR